MDSVSRHHGPSEKYHRDCYDGQIGTVGPRGEGSGLGKTAGEYPNAENKVDDRRERDARFVWVKMCGTSPVVDGDNHRDSRRTRDSGDRQRGGFGGRRGGGHRSSRGEDRTDQDWCAARGDRGEADESMADAQAGGETVQAEEAQTHGPEGFVQNEADNRW
ncbi:hypothetical protein LTR66_017395 [Elasticomyces elasticus]|nr:hypothetical protein LTR66_017395 [Elasticomyces elasticus]